MKAEHTIDKRARAGRATQIAAMATTGLVAFMWLYFGRLYLIHDPEEWRIANQQLGYLKPEHFTLYLHGDAKPLLTQARMRLDLNGNTELLQAFWNLPENPTHPNLVPPLLAYADLMATQNGRNLETARLLYEQFLEPLYRT
jgi:Transcriptional regulator, AbiEi antitoxin, Type IV TA system